MEKTVDLWEKIIIFCPALALSLNSDQPQQLLPDALLLIMGQQRLMSAVRKHYSPCMILKQLNDTVGKKSGPNPLNRELRPLPVT